MKKTKTKPAPERRPHIERAIRIAHDHILYAQSHPAQLASIASRLKISKEAALAYAIADQITEEFLLTENGE